MTAADGVPRTTYMLKSIERGYRGMIAWSERLEGDAALPLRFRSVQAPRYIHGQIDTHTHTQPATLDPWEAYSLILATFSPRFHYPPPPAAYRQNVTACQFFFFTSESSVELRRFPPKFVHIGASHRYFVYVLADATIFRYREINARCTAGLETRVARFFDSMGNDKGYRTRRYCEFNVA